MRLLLASGPRGWLLLAVWAAAVAELAFLADVAATRITGAERWGVVATAACAVAGWFLPMYLTRHRRHP